MSNPTNPSARDHALRTLLVDTVERTPRRRRWRLATTAGAIACVLGGAAVGGAITAAASPDPAAIEAQSRASIVMGAAAGSSMRVLGTPVGQVGTSDQVIDVGAAPRGADSFVWIATCRSGSGTIAAGRPGAQLGSPARCGSDASVTASTAADRASGSRIRIVAVGDVRWTLSFAWMETRPLPSPSAAQDAATEDGIVTRSEYLAAFDRLQGCMTARGHALGRVPTSSLFVAFGLPDVAAGDWCTASEFDDVSSLWQSEHPAPAGEDSTWGDQRYDPAADPRYAG